MLAATTKAPHHSSRSGIRACSSRSTTMDRWELMSIRLTERGREAVRQWPPRDAYEAFADLLEDRIDAEGDPAERTRLEKARDSLGSVSREVFGSIASAWVRAQFGL